MIDLHTHSSKSDGSLSPTELINRAKKVGLNAIALTDHDTVNGLDEAMEAGAQIGIKVVPGIELSTKLDDHSVHIVGLFIDRENQSFQEFLQMQKDTREGRNFHMISNLIDLGFNISFADFPPVEDNVVITKGNIAAVLVERGYADTTSEAINKYLEEGCPAYVKRKHIHPQKGIEAIHMAGGIAVLAHFNQIVRKDRDVSEAYARQIAAMGLDAIETRYSEFDDDYTQRAEKIADEFGLLRSGGSDYHGAKVKPDIFLGKGKGNLVVPDEYLETIEEAVKNKK